ncbi:MAG: enolase C-terminal domain-like protein, partial [Limisphaerales bacterium]
MLDQIIEHLEVSAYQIPTDFPESDGTLEWNSTTLVLVEAGAGDARGLGYTYCSQSCAALISEKLFPLIHNRPLLESQSHWNSMVSSIRNLGRPGIASCAIAAVDIALWDLKARLLELPLVQLLGQVRQTVPVYGSGGFTSY